VVFFPVRHHSPTAARLLRDLALAIKPAGIFIECPADFNDRLHELLLPHQPPIAIYSYVRRADNSRLGAFYPMCEHSPEWQAIQVGQELGAEVRFIDLPWGDIVSIDQEAEAPEDLSPPEPRADLPLPENRFSDTLFLRSQYIERLCKKLGVDDFHTLWDTLFEIDPALSIDTWFARCHQLCSHMRCLDGVGDLSDRCREAYMAEQIRDGLGRLQGQILVVVGGAHCLPLYARINNIDQGRLTQPPVFVAEQDGEERGIALTPFSFERLDSLTGYDAGMPNPGFYQQLWRDRLDGRNDTHRKLLANIVDRLREAKQPVSSADLIATETTATALASMRAHPVVWRSDLVDALIGSLIKEDLTRAGKHPLLEAVHAVMRGGQRGMLAAGTTRPPLVIDIQTQLELYNLQPRPVPREVELVLDNAEHRPASQVLHRVRLLALAGYDRTAGTDMASRDEMVTIWERWRIGWSPDFDARCIEAARYGASLADATAAVLGERASQIDHSAAPAAALLLDAALAGCTDLAWALRQRVVELIRADGDFFSLTGALSHLLYLYRYDTVLQTAGTVSMGELLSEAFTRSLWLLESLGQTAGRDAEAIEGVISLRETFERCELMLGLNRQELLQVLGRVRADKQQGAVVRGAALGAEWSLGASDPESVRVQMRQFLDPERLGDFLAGLFALAREQVQRQRELLVAIHDVVTAWSDDEFLSALPSLRLAFTYFTPREKHHLALTLRQALGLEKVPQMTALQVDVATAARAMVFEGKLLTTAAKVGLRGCI
jgi:hypothetical protein